LKGKQLATSTPKSSTRSYCTYDTGYHSVSDLLWSLQGLFIRWNVHFM